MEIRVGGRKIKYERLEGENIAYCENCHRAVRFAEKEWLKLVGAAASTALEVLDSEIKCCERPSFFWVLDWE